MVTGWKLRTSEPSNGELRGVFRHFNTRYV